jgi:chemotaxis signal transduction protein
MLRPALNAPPATHLIVRVGQYELALPNAAIRLIAPHPQMVPIPDAAPWLLGVLSDPSGAIPVIDTAAALGIDASPDRERPTVVVVQSPTESPLFPTIGLLVDRIADTARIPSSEWRPLRPSSTLAFRNSIEACWRGRSRPCYLIRLAALIPTELEARLSAFCLR